MTRANKPNPVLALASRERFSSGWDGGNRLHDWHIITGETICGDVGQEEISRSSATQEKERKKFAVNRITFARGILFFLSLQPIRKHPFTRHLQCSMPESCVRLLSTNFQFFMCTLCTHTERVLTHTGVWKEYGRITRTHNTTAQQLNRVKEEAIKRDSTIYVLCTVYIPVTTTPYPHDYKHFTNAHNITLVRTGAPRRCSRARQSLDTHLCFAHSTHACKANTADV